MFWYRNPDPDGAGLSVAVGWRCPVSIVSVVPFTHWDRFLNPAVLEGDGTAENPRSLCVCEQGWIPLETFPCFKGFCFVLDLEGVCLTSEFSFRLLGTATRWSEESKLCLPHPQRLHCLWLPIWLPLHGLLSTNVHHVPPSRQAQFRVLPALET